MYKLIKVRSKCQLKGCRSTGLKVPTYSASASKEGGRSVIVCEPCIEGMFEKLCQMRGVPTHAELLAMQKADGIMPNDDEKEAMLSHIKLLAEENEKLKAENAELKVLREGTGEDEPNNTKEPDAKTETDEVEQEAVDKEPEVKTTRGKAAKKSE